MNQEPPAARWPRSVYGTGEDPDPRFSLANERTFLAWIRTALALLAGAAAVHVIELDLSAAAARAVSAGMALAGLLCAVNGWWGWMRTERALRTARPLPSNAGGAILTVVVVIAAIVVAALGLTA
jgi:putative membrane protein